jgi:hypothetical protein
MKVKTRDWGSKYAQLEAHIGAKAKAYAEHWKELQDEIKNHTGHAYSRHGYQAGWVEQLIRCVTGITPDQTFSPTGVEGVIREWNERWIGSPTGEFSKIVNTYDATGNVVMGAPSSGYVPLDTDYKTSPGLEAGGFLNPEYQQRAMTKAMTIANLHLNVAQAEYPGISKPWKDVTRCMVVVDASPSAGFGVGFRRTGSFVTRTRKDVLELVEAMELHKTREEAGLTSSDVLVATPDGVIMQPEKDRVAFSSVSDLLDYLGVEAFWQKTALVVLQKDSGTWKRVTMYPCNLVGEGWAPATKVPGKQWSGNVKLSPSGTAHMTVPAWAPK